jgi:hypothetical protein
MPVLKGRVQPGALLECHVCGRQRRYLDSPCTIETQHCAPVEQGLQQGLGMMPNTGSWVLSMYNSLLF